MTSSETSIKPGIFRVLAAAFYDAIMALGVVMLAATLVIIPANLLFGIENVGRFPLFRLYILTVAASFFLWFWTHGGQTIGLRAWRLKIQRENGSDITPREAVVRLTAAVLFVPLFGLGYLWMFLDPEGKTLHDRIAGTLLVRVNS